MSVLSVVKELLSGQDRHLIALAQAMKSPYSVLINNLLCAIMDSKRRDTSLLMITDSSLSGKNTECIYYNETNPEVIGKSSIPTIMANSREYVLLLLVMQPDLYIILFTCRAPITTY